MKYLQQFNNFTPISENLKYHLDNNLSILENVFRPYSDSFYNLLTEARNLYDNGFDNFSDLDKNLFENTDFGKFVQLEGKIVPLDLPIENVESIFEAEYAGKKVKLNKPMRSSGPKKYKVYVKNPKTGKVKVVHFGDIKGGLTSKMNDKEARKSFVARHKCDMKKDRTKPGYWSCNLPRYAKYLGLAGGGNFYW
jgi:hypothetical protein